MIRYWLSFVVDGKNAGVSIVKAETFLRAVERATVLGINKGGEVAGWPIAEGHPYAPPDHIFDRALTNEEVEWLGFKSSHSPTQYDSAMSKADSLCPRCHSAQCGCN